MMIAISGIIGHNAWVDLERGAEVAATDTAYVAAMLGENVSRSYADVLHALETVERDFLVRSAMPLPLVRQRLQTAVTAKTATLTQIAAMTVFDQRGHPIAHGGTSEAVEAHVELAQVLRAMSFGSARISLLPMTRTGGGRQRWLPVALRLALHDGSFGGAVVAFIDPAHFEALQRTLAARFPGTRTSVTVGGERLSGSGAAFPTDAVSGTAASDAAERPEGEGRSKGQLVIDGEGQRWLVARRELPGAGFAVAAALPYDDVVAAWLERRTADIAAGGLSLLVLLSFVLVATRQIAKRSKAESARDAARGQMLEALRSMSDGFALYDADERLVLFNERFRSLFGEQRDAVVPGASVERLREAAAAIGASGAADDDDGRVLPVRPRGLRASSSGLVSQHPDGRWFMLAEQPTADGGTVALYADITELKTREAEYYAAKEQAEAANRAKSEFLAIVSHELRTPLNAIIGFSELIRDETFGPLGSEKYNEYAEAINGSGIHLLDLINDILDISKLEAGKVDLYDEPLDLSRIAAKVSELMLPRAREKSITLVCDIDGGLPHLRADARSIKQILLNLVSNAVKFTPTQGRVTIALGLSAGGEIVVSVRDTGIGIAAQDIPRVLEPFGQVEGAMTHHEGTGLGLPLCVRLAELQGGRLEIDSTPGEGTTVEVVFPADRTMIREQEPKPERSLSAT